MKKPHEPKVIQVSEKDRKHMLKLHNEIHKRDEDIGEILGRYMKTKVQQVFSIPRYPGSSRKAISKPKNVKVAVNANGSVGIYDEASGL